MTSDKSKVIVDHAVSGVPIGRRSPRKRGPYSTPVNTLEIPPTYPGAQIYGFYTYPPLALSSGRTIDSTQLRGTVNGREFHGWSRHRGAAAPWNPAMDNVVSQLALADAALAKEVGE